MVKTYYNQLSTVKKLSESIEITYRGFLYLKKTLSIEPDIYFMNGKKRIPGYSFDSIPKLIQVIQSKQIEKTKNKKRVLNKELKTLSYK